MTPGAPQGLPQLLPPRRPVVNPQKKAIAKVFDVTVGRYDVSVTMGPSYQSRRQEAVASIMALVQAYPQIMNIAGDLLLDNMEWPGHKELAKRFKKTLPPNLQDDPGDDPDQMVTKLQAQLQEMSKQHELLTKALTEATERINSKMDEMQLQKYKIDKESETKIAAAEITAKTQNSAERTKMFIALWTEMHGSAHGVAMQAAQQAHEKFMASQEPPQPAAAEPQPGE